jgi:hypothetical protein
MMDIKDRIHIPHRNSRPPPDKGVYIGMGVGLVLWLLVLLTFLAR